MVDPRQLDSDEVWQGKAQQDSLPQSPPQFIPWQELDVPLPHRGARCWGYALTYSDHKRETINQSGFRFLKLGSVAANSAPIPYREHLDFELEIGVLMHRDTPERFGYFLANDLTDRGLQVDHYDARNPAPGFTKAKDFPGSLRAGPLLAVGDASLWPQLTASLTLNEQDRQTLRAAECRLNPSQLHEELFQDHKEEEWLLAVTGTTAGTLFRTPRTRELLKALAVGKLSPKRARRSWLKTLRFLTPGDTLVLQSPLLGRCETRVISTPNRNPCSVTTERSIRSYTGADGKELDYIVYLPHPASKRVAFVYLHGIESHAGWFDLAANLLETEGYPVYCLDRRGSGINRDNRGFPTGHCPKEIDLTEDVHRAITTIRAESEAEKIYLIGLSWGGKYAVAYDILHPGSVDGLVLITPGIMPKVDLRFCEKLAVARDIILSPERRHRIPIEPEMFTATPQFLEYIRNDPLRLHKVTASFLWQSRNMDKLLAHGQPQAPMIVFLAGKDRIIDNEKTRDFLAKHQERGIQIIEYEDQTHSIQLDAPKRLIADILAWVTSREAR